MFNFDVPRYEKVVGDAIALRPQIEKAVDEICKEGYSNIFFIGCGGTYAHSLPMKYWFDTTSEIETHSVIAAEFMVSGHKRFTKDSVCVFSTRSGNTKEIVAAIKYCKEAGARTLVYVSNDNTPACEYADYKFFSFAEDDCLCEAIYTYMITLLARLFYGEDETRPLMDRVKNFSEKVTKVINIFDTKEVELPFTDAEYRKIVSPMIMYAITERLSCHLEKERNHPLTTRRYYRQMEY